MKYQEALAYVAQLSCTGITPGLERIVELCRRMGNPQEKLQFVHIAGTNGKGSTLAYISTILQTAGYCVGRYISPTIFDYRERIQVNGQMIGKVTLAEGMGQIREQIEGMRADGFEQTIGLPSAFEAETVLAFWYFVKKKCDLVVLETGMGGLEDATNLIQNTKLAVLASISMDHMGFLGDTLEQIAAQKAGIIKPGCVVVSQKQDPRAERVIEQTCAEKKVTSLSFVEAEKITGVKYGLEKQYFNYLGLQKLEIHMAGQYQIDNAALAVNAIYALGQMGYPVSEDKLREGLRNCTWPGRFYVMQKKPLFVVDGAHNEDAAIRLAQSIDFYFTNKRIIYIMGVLRDKEYEKIIDLTAKYADQIITVKTPDNPRALPALDLAQAVAKVNPNVTAVDSLEEAVEMSKLLAGRDDVILAFGSLSFLGQLMTILRAK